VIQNLMFFKFPSPWKLWFGFYWYSCCS